MDAETRKHKIREHLEALQALEVQDAANDSPPAWPPRDYYLLWHVVVGMTLGTLGAMVSLLANGLAAPLFGKRALELVRVYLTFPMGARALELDDGTVLFVGCVLYLVTGALYGILIHLLLSTRFTGASMGRRLAIATAIGLGLWIVNFYLVLSWLQPLLLGGNWIVRLVPPWVGALTHLVFTWTVAAAEGWGRFESNGKASLPRTITG